MVVKIYMRNHHLFLLSLLAFVLFGIVTLFIVPVSRADSAFGTAVTFTCTDTETAVAARGGPQVTAANQTIYIGYRQLGNNKDPIIVSFTDGAQDWCRTDYETTGDDNTGYGLYWDGTAMGLYAAFSATGTQGSSDNDFRRFATDGWLRSYTDGSLGGGGGPKVAVVAHINPSNGDVHGATFITSLLSNGKTNSMQLNDMSLQNGALWVSANAWYSPRNPDKTGMDCSGSSPFDYTLYLTPDLSSAIYTTADGCIGNAPALPQRIEVSPQIGFVGENDFTASVNPIGVQYPLTYTWMINDTIVRQVATSSPTDILTYTWIAPTVGQTMQVAVTNQMMEALAQPPVQTAVYHFDVVEAQHTYLPLLRLP